METEQQLCASPDCDRLLGMLKKITGTRLEVGLYVVLVVSLAIGALILSDLVLGVGAAIAALALAGALSARRRELTNDDETGS